MNEEIKNVQNGLNALCGRVDVLAMRMTEIAEVLRLLKENRVADEKWITKLGPPTSDQLQRVIESGIRL